MVEIYPGSQFGALFECAVRGDVGKEEGRVKECRWMDRWIDMKDVLTHLDYHFLVDKCLYTSSGGGGLISVLLPPMSNARSRTSPTSLLMHTMRRGRGRGASDERTVAVD